jgi:lysophospholipase L1-like esterase
MSKFLLVAVGLLLGLVVGEIGIRVADVAPEVVYIEKWRMRLSSNPKIGFEPIPHLDSSEASVQYFGYRGLSNSMGFRDYEHEIQKAPGAKRIIVIGDSVTAGLWIKKDEDVFAAKLEKKLQSTGPNLDVLNFGVSGYNTQQEVAMLKEKGLRYAPDLVILAYCLNDRWQDDGGVYFHLLEESKQHEEVQHHSVPSVIRTSALFRFMRYRVLPSFGYTLPKPETRDPKVFGEDTVDESFGVLEEISNQYGFQVLVVVFPELEGIDKGETEYPSTEEHQRTQQLAERHGFQFLDLLTAMRECKENNPKRLIAFDRFHPRPLGNDCAAEAIAKTVEQIW